jgi:hypothetical protein
MIGSLGLGMMILANAPSKARLVKIPLRVNFGLAGEVSKEFNGIKPGFLFDEVIPSWNIDEAQNGAIKVELRINTPQGKSRWYVLGDWSGDKEWYPRQSTEGQKDDHAKVSTDTFKVLKPTDAVDLKITLKSRGLQPVSRLKLLTLSFSDTKSTQVATDWKPSKLRGVTIDVPQRAQGNYPNGKVLCSATSTSMLLQHWSKVLSRPEDDRDVPEVESNVWDPVYKGAGNWPFNAAYFGSFKGYKGVVSRLTSIEDLERLVSAGIPVATSVSFDMLRGRPLSPSESGHLILVVGFEEDGTPVVNDPAFKEGVRKTYPRVDFEKAWCYSHRTVYLMVPDSITMPKDPNRVWSFR